MPKIKSHGVTAKEIKFLTIYDIYSNEEMIDIKFVLPNIHID